MQRVFSLFLTALLLASPAYAQYAAGTTGADSVLAGVSATEVEVTGPGVPYHEKADINSQILGRLYRDTPLVAYPAQGMFYAVGRPGEEHIGYVRQRYLRARGSGKRIAGPVARGEGTDITLAQKSPATAGLLSFLVPGAGQIYSGRVEKGVLLLVTSSAAPLLGYAASDVEDGFRRDTDFTPLWVGIGVSTVAWFVGVATAPYDARDYNRHLREMADRNIRVGPMATRTGGKQSYGLQVSMQF